MTFRILHGDCREILPTLEADSVHAVVCDPPYHLTTGKRGALYGIGLAIAAAGAMAMDVPFTADLRVIALAFAVSALIGVIFGFFPARRAARLHHAVGHHQADHLADVLDLVDGEDGCQLLLGRVVLAVHGASAAGHALGHGAQGVKRLGCELLGGHGLEVGRGIADAQGLCARRVANKAHHREQLRRLSGGQ